MGLTCVRVDTPGNLEGPTLRLPVYPQPTTPPGRWSATKDTLLSEVGGSRQVPVGVLTLVPEGRECGGLGVTSDVDDEPGPPPGTREYFVWVIGPAKTPLEETPTQPKLRAPVTRTVINTLLPTRADSVFLQTP